MSYTEDQKKRMIEKLEEFNRLKNLRKEEITWNVVEKLLEIKNYVMYGDKIKEDGIFIESKGIIKEVPITDIIIENENRKF